jgi:hypothetical protein
MPIRSGYGPPQIEEVRKDGVRLRFSPELAKKLELESEVDVVCNLSDEIVKDLCELRDAFAEIKKIKERSEPL